MKIRRIEILVGPFTDVETTDTSSALQVVSTGMHNELSVGFVVEKTIASSSNKAEITFTNLNRETETKFNQENLAIEIRAGYPDSDAGVLVLHKGGVKIVEPSGNQLRVTSADGAGAFFLAVSNRSYSGGEPLERVVRDLVSDMPNIAIGKISLTGNIGFKGRHLVGSTKDKLNDLAHQFAFTWSVQDGVFQAFKDSASTEKTYLFTENNIEDIRPIIGTDGSQSGFQMKSYLDPRINAGDLLEISSKITPQYNGVYRVDKHVLSGQSHEPGWSSRFDLGVV